MPRLCAHWFPFPSLRGSALCLITVMDRMNFLYHRRRRRHHHHDRSALSKVESLQKCPFQKVIKGIAFLKIPPPGIWGKKGMSCLKFASSHQQMKPVLLAAKM